MNRRDAWAGGGLALALTALLWPIAHISVDQHHDGIMLKPAFDVLAGQVLFRDSFTQYGALSSYLQAGALWISPTLLSIRLLTVAAYTVTLMMLYAAWRHVLPRSLAVVAGIFFILFIPLYEKDYWDHQYWTFLPWSSVYAMMFQAVGVYALCRVLTGGPSRSWGLLLGVACACVFWCRQPVGVTMAASLALAGGVAWWTRWAPTDVTRRELFLRVIAGFAALNLVMFGGILLAGAFPAWWEQNIVWPARWSGSVDWMDTLPFTIHPLAMASLVLLGFALAVPGWAKRRWPGWSWRCSAGYFLGLAAFLVWQRDWWLQALDVSTGGWLLLVPLVVLGVMARCLWQARRGPAGAYTTEFHLTCALAAVSLASLAQYYPMADGWHIFDSLAPVFGLFVLAVWRWTGWSAAWLTVVLLAAMLPAAYRKAVAIPPAVNRPLITLTRPALLRGMRVPPPQAISLLQIDDTFARVLQAAPDIPTALIGDNALYLCLGHNRTNPIPYYVTWRGLASQPDNVRRWAYIARERPLLVLQSARWAAVDEFYQRANYVPLRYIPAETLEIAVPGELAARMGLGAYGIDPEARRR